MGASTIDPTTAASQQRYDTFVSNGLVTVQPVAASGSGRDDVSGANAAARWALRAAIFSPRDKAVLPLLGYFAIASLAVIGAPFAYCILASCTYLCAYVVYRARIVSRGMR